MNEELKIYLINNINKYFKSNSFKFEKIFSSSNTTLEFEKNYYFFSDSMGRKVVLLDIAKSSPILDSYENFISTYPKSGLKIFFKDNIGDRTFICLNVIEGKRHSGVELSFSSHHFNFLKNFYKHKESSKYNFYRELVLILKEFKNNINIKSEDLILLRYIIKTTFYNYLLTQRNLYKTTIHGDLHRGNVILDNDTFKFIDLEFSRRSHAIYDDYFGLYRDNIEILQEHLQISNFEFNCNLVFYWINHLYINSLKDIYFKKNKDEILYQIYLAFSSLNIVQINRSFISEICRCSNDLYFDNKSKSFELSKYKISISHKEKKIDKLKIESNTLDCKIINLSKEVEYTKNENDYLKDKVERIQNSFSWNLTKPLRFIRRTFKNFICLNKQKNKNIYPNSVPIIARPIYVKKLNFKHSGDLGDIIWSLPTIRALGGGTLYLDPNGGKGHIGESTGLATNSHSVNKLNENSINQIKPLLLEQDYISDVKFWNERVKIDINLDIFRQPKNLIFNNIAYSHLHAFNIDFDEANNAWIDLKENNYSSPYNRDILIARTTRYTANYGYWDSISAELEKLAFFVGYEFEHQIWEYTFNRRVPYYKTKDILDLAKAIKSANNVISNQGLVNAIAEGMKRTLICEIDKSSPAVIFDREGATYV